jgi:O-antigen/teichoic acid export membrane protein
MGLVTIGLVPRALGPADYGRFEFISNNFKLVLDTLTIHVPSAFFNWVSRKGHKADTDLATGVTLYFVGIVSFLFAVIIALSLMTGLHSTLWPDVAPPYLWEAFGLTLAVFAFQLCSYLADGRALTIGLEKMRLVQNIGKAAICLVLVWFGLMNLHTFFFSQMLITGLAALFTAWWLYREKAVALQSIKPWQFPRTEIDRYVSFIKTFIHPLVWLVAAGFLFSYFDRWFLQLIGGSSEFGYFGLSDRLGAVAFIFTSAMTPLLTREFAFAHEEKDKARLSGLFDRIKIFLFIAVTLSCFLSIQSASIVEVIGGDKFRGAVLPISIMALYPIHQTFGQLSSALLIATGQTGLYSKIGLLCMFASVPVTYFLMAPGTYSIPGMGWGATGLAVKMVIVNIIATNIQLFYNTKFLDISFRNWLVYQLKLVGIIYGIAAVSHVIIAGIPDALLMSLDIFRIDPSVFIALVRIGISGLLYLTIIFILLILAPDLAGIGRHDVRDFCRKYFIGS